MEASHHKKIPVAEPDISGKEAEYVVDAIRNERRISSSGKYLDTFESYGKQHFGREHALACSNGTTALHLALHALHIGPGDEVIVPTFTFAATAAVVVHCGATPVFIDVKKSDWLLDPALLDSVYTERTKAVIAVDLYGLPCDYDVILEWCEKKGVFLIEDAAEAHGAVYRGKPVGSFGVASCFSFFGNKILTTGEGGMILSNQESFIDEARTLRNHGMRIAGTYKHEVPGFNYRLTNIQAAVGCAQFERFEEFREIRKRHADYYKECLKDTPEITFQSYDENVIVPAHWLTTILLSVPREAVMQYLTKKNIETRPVFIPMHEQKAYAGYATGTFPVADDIARRGLSLPSSTLLTDEDIAFVATSLKEAIAYAKELG